MLGNRGDINDKVGHLVGFGASQPGFELFVLPFER